MLNKEERKAIIANDVEISSRMIMTDEELKREVIEQFFYYTRKMSHLNNSPENIFWEIKENEHIKIATGPAFIGHNGKAYACKSERLESEHCDSPIETVLSLLTKRAIDENAIVYVLSISDYHLRSGKNIIVFRSMAVPK